MASDYTLSHATRDDGLPWLFISERQTKLTRFAVNDLVDRTARAAGLRMTGTRVPHFEPVSF
jgi:hypothetical protein